MDKAILFDKGLYGVYTGKYLNGAIEVMIDSEGPELFAKFVKPAKETITLDPVITDKKAFSNQFINAFTYQYQKIPSEIKSDYPLNEFIKKYVKPLLDSYISEYELKGFKFGSKPKSGNKTNLAKSIAIARIRVLKLKSIAGLAGTDNYADLFEKAKPFFSLKQLKAFSFYEKETNGFKDFSGMTSVVKEDWKKFVAVAKKIVDSYAIAPGYVGGRNFLGKNYRSTKDFDIKDIAKLVREELAIEFPSGKFSVKIERYSGGQSINVKILDVGYNPFTDKYSKSLESGESWDSFYDREIRSISANTQREAIYKKDVINLEKKAESILQQYNYDTSDSMTDYFNVRYYGSAQLDKEALMQKYYPNHPDSVRNRQWDEEWKAKSEKASKIAEQLKGRIKKGSILFFKAELHKSWHKFLLPNGNYLVLVAKSPNGRGKYGRYSVIILQQSDTGTITMFEKKWKTTHPALSFSISTFEQNSSQADSNPFDTELARALAIARLRILKLNKNNDDNNQ